MSTKQKRFILPEDEIPKYWYNIQADMKTKPMPPLNPKTKEALKPEDLYPIFAKEDVYKRQSCGVVPAVLYHLQKSRDFSDMRILRALATAGLIGNIVKHNASISGAEAGCQAEVGVACSMASAAASQLFGGSPAQIEYAAEMGLEHHLGMTCDPVCGLVQIPCIERNAYAAARALDANIYSAFTDGNHLSLIHI